MNDGAWNTPVSPGDGSRWAAAPNGSGARPHDGAALVAEALRSRREQLAQRWADATPFRAVYVAGRDAAVGAAHRLVDALAEVAGSGRCADPSAPGFGRVRPQLAEMLAERGAAGATAVQLGAEVAELRHALLALVRDHASHEGGDAGDAGDAVVAAMELVGTLRLVAMETVLDRDAGIIARQRQEILDIATPVLRLWDGVLAVPLIGTLDSARSQVMTEALLEGIVEQRAEVAILDITGVPMVDTVVAQHLMRTATAVRLMGATCVLSGIRPQIAQTIAALGIDLGGIRTRSTLADALAWALRHIGEPAGG
ncbi:STAS domain-containing protein [Actinomadura kijaniata]|uniref:RsbT co-antagonist protein RsbR n=1 Tax=Actinomadura namibiensis TaxID=182080 RepID=A0A7W3LIM7_ACTNM|nr:STAS domain-containing protein [Actinomadura namibiensis]MBA8948752.1 rsbT co-antagonist protein RsbR [Actinomadura namibiensis]